MPRGGACIIVICAFVLHGCIIAASSKNAAMTVYSEEYSQTRETIKNLAVELDLGLLGISEPEYADLVLENIRETEAIYSITATDVRTRKYASNYFEQDNNYLLNIKSKRVTRSSGSHNDIIDATFIVILKRLSPAEKEWQTYFSARIEMTPYMARRDSGAQWDERSAKVLVTTISHELEIAGFLKKNNLNP